MLYIYNISHAVPSELSNFTSRSPRLRCPERVTAALPGVRRKVGDGGWWESRNELH